MVQIYFIETDIIIFNLTIMQWYLWFSFHIFISLSSLIYLSFPRLNWNRPRSVLRLSTPLWSLHNLISHTISNRSYQLPSKIVSLFRLARQWQKTKRKTLFRWKRKNLNPQVLFVIVMEENELAFYW